MRRRARKKLRMIIMTSGIILMSPFVAGILIKGMDILSAASEKLSEITVGEEIVSTETESADDTEKYDYFPSEGFGWIDENIVSETDKADDGGAEPYPTQWNTGTGQVVQTTYGKYSGTQYFDLDKAGQVKNLTDIPSRDLLSQSRMRPEFKIELNSQPQVLIMHTHTTESFEPYEREFFDSSFGYRTTDSSKNMVMVGDAIAEQLENSGIVTVHDTTIHDYPSYNGSYERSAETVKKILAQYPSIKVVLDIHRDAIASEDSLIQPVTEIDGKKASQVMIISGCDDGTMDMPDYLYNFRFACMIQQQMESSYAGLTRPILFDYRKYNQNLTTGSLLIEVGSHGNTLEQSRYAGELIGKSVAEVLLSLKE